MDERSEAAITVKLTDIAIMTTMGKKKHPAGKKARSGKIAAKVEGQKNEILPGIPIEQQFGMITEVVYLIVEQRGSQWDASVGDWLKAEVGVDARLSLGS